MRLLLFCSAALLALAMLVAACDTVSPGDCYPNTSGGFGGSGTIPIGAGVGVGSGDFRSPRLKPPANPCVTMGGDTAGAGAPAGDATSSGASGAGGSVVA